MTKSDVNKMFRDFKVSLSKHSPEILTGLGIAGMITTTILAVKATPKALELIDEAKRTPSETNEARELKPIEVVKVAWKPYIPAAITGTVSISCLIGASRVNAKRNAALATAYKLSETALTRYREKVVETIGEKKEKVVRDAVAKEKMEENPASKTEVIVVGNHETLFYDELTDRYFKHDIEQIKKIINELNRRMISENCVSLNDFYLAVGLKNVPIGDVLGWNVNRGFIDIYFSPQKDDNEQPCLALDFVIAPMYDYDQY